MNNAYLDKAKKIITDPKMLSVVAAKRARQLAQGARPMVKCDSENHLDVALLEIAEGKLIDATPEEVAQMVEEASAEFEQERGGEAQS